jgi:hypothetical protein
MAGARFYFLKPVHNLQSAIENLYSLPQRLTGMPGWPQRTMKKISGLQKLQKEKGTVLFHQQRIGTLIIQTRLQAN